MNLKRITFVLFLLFAAAYYIARLGLFYAGVTRTVDFDVLVTDSEREFINYSCLGIGLFGFVFLVWVVMGRSWGIWGTIVVGGYTIAFDIWAVVAVAGSAALGFVPGVVLIGYPFVMQRYIVNRVKKRGRPQRI